MRVILNDGSILTTMDEIADAYLVAYAAEKAASADLKLATNEIKANSHLAWFYKAISVKSADRKSLDQKLVLILLERLGATPEQVAACYKESHFLKVSPAK